MSITIKDSGTAREIVIDLNICPMRFTVKGLHTQEEIDSYQGPLGDVFYIDGKDTSHSTRSIHTAFEDLGEDTRSELTKIAQEARKLMDRAKGLLENRGLLEPEPEASVQ
jgi:hypothetical protein